MKKTVLFLTLCLMGNAHAGLSGVDTSWVSNLVDFFWWGVSIVGVLSILTLIVSKVFSLNLPDIANNILQILIVIVIVLWAGTIIQTLLASKGGSGYLLL